MIVKRIRRTDERVALGELLVADQPRLGLVDDAVDFDHAGLAAAFSAVEGQRETGRQPGSQNAFVLSHVDGLPAPHEGDVEGARHQRLLIAVMMR